MFVVGNKIDIGALADTLAKELSLYTADIAEEVKAAAEETTNELLDNIRADAPKRKGKYKKAMAVKTTLENDFQKVNVWYVKKPYYGLPHLLEKGHAKRNGGRTQAFPHIEKNAEAAKQNFSLRVERVVKNGGK